MTNTEIIDKIELELELFTKDIERRVTAIRSCGNIDVEWYDSLTIEEQQRLDKAVEKVDKCVNHLAIDMPF